MEVSRKMNSPSKINPSVAWLIIFFTIVGTLTTGLYLGNRFFWDRYLKQTKEEYSYRVALKQVKNHPNNISAHINLGWALLELKEYEKAVKEFEQALAFDPGNETAAYDIAIALSRQGKLAEAEDKLKALIKENPKFVQARHDLAIVEMNLGKYDEALKQYQYVNISRPGNADVIYQMGIAFFKLGDMVKAKEYYSKALNYDPNFSEAKAALANLN